MSSIKEAREASKHASPKKEQPEEPEVSDTIAPFNSIEVNKIKPGESTLPQMQLSSTRINADQQLKFLREQAEKRRQEEEEEESEMSDFVGQD